MEEIKKNTYKTFEDKGGNIYHVTRDETGRAHSATREKDGKFFYMVEHEDGRIALISEEQARELAEEAALYSKEEFEFIKGDAVDADLVLDDLFLVDVPDDDDYINHSIKNAIINPEKLYLDEKRKEIRYTYKIKSKENKVNDATIKIKPKEEKLSDIISQLPYGLIDKQVTGIGATYLELHSNRNSIIVTPTRTLAWNKSKDNDMFLYVGTKAGVNNATRKDEIKTYLNRKDIEYKKILVVADSLEKVIEAIKENQKDVFSTYFLLVDEIDTLQSDNHYRPALSRVIDYYFKFERHCRALLSATVREFTIAVKLRT